MRPSWLQHLDQKWRPRAAIGACVERAESSVRRLVLDLWDEYEHEFWETDPSDEEAMAAASRELVSSLGLQPQTNVLTLGLLQVHPSMLREGIGSRVLADLEQSASAHGCMAVFLQSGDLGYGHSLGFWLRMNYKAIPGSRYFDDCLMVKLLAPGGMPVTPSEERRRLLGMGPTKDYAFETDCIHSDGPSIWQMKDLAHPVTYRTMLSHCDLVGWAADHGYDRRSSSGHGITLATDPRVRYFKSFYRGRPCYYLVWSGIEQIFVKKV